MVGSIEVLLVALAVAFGSEVVESFIPAFRITDPWYGVECEISCL